MGLNPSALRKAKIVCNFDLSECNRIKYHILTSAVSMQCHESVRFDSHLACQDLVGASADLWPKACPCHAQHLHEKSNAK